MAVSETNTTWYKVDLGAGHIVLDGFPALRERGTAPSLLGPCLLWPRSPISATAELLLFFKILTVRRLKRAELRRQPKLGRNRSKCGRDMAIFRFFQDGGRPRVRTTHKEHLVVFIAVQNLDGIDAVVLIICMFFDFTSLD